MRARSPLSSLVRCLLVLYTGDAKLAVVCWSAVGVGGLQQRRPLRAASHWRPALSRLLEATLAQALSEASAGREGRVAAGHGASPCLQSYAARCDDLLRHGHVAPREAAWLMAPSFGLLRSSGAALAPIVRARARASFDDAAPPPARVVGDEAQAPASLSVSPPLSQVRSRAYFDECLTVGRALQVSLLLLLLLLLLLQLPLILI